MIVDGYFVNATLSDAVRLEWAIRGFLCLPGYLVAYPGSFRCYLNRAVVPVKVYAEGTAIVDYLGIRKESDRSPGINH